MESESLVQKVCVDLTHLRLRRVGISRKRGRRRWAYRALTRDLSGRCRIVDEYLPRHIATAIEAASLAAASLFVRGYSTCPHPLPA